MISSEEYKRNFKPKYTARNAENCIAELDLKQMKIDEKHTKTVATPQNEPWIGIKNDGYDHCGAVGLFSNGSE